jgi:isoleucyl-tRNA synthetase
MFKDVKSTYDAQKLELEILGFWEKTKAFEKMLAQGKQKKRWSFIDGPITANNPMGLHHAWGRTYKDLFRRYKAMNGYLDRYQNGFDVQGLWVEVEVEKELAFKSKRDIETYGISNFVKRCKQRALKYAALQVEQSIRLGYWMNWDSPDFLRNLARGLEEPERVITIHRQGKRIRDTVERMVGKLGTPELGGSYFTFSDENNFMIWTLLKKCHRKGLIYKGRDVCPWCPRCSTALSQHEIATEGYREITHVGLTLKFPLRGRSNEALLVWTTTPWTLSSNVAVAVNPDIIYVKVRYGSQELYLAKAALTRTLSEDGFEIVEEIAGEDMVGWAYDGPFDDLPEVQKQRVTDAHRVIPWKEVSEAEGSGFVHIAPGCGKEDHQLGREHGLPAIAPLDEFGVFVENFGRLTGVHVYESAELVLRSLRDKGLLFKEEPYTHRYPVCWRCGNELVFRLVNEWFISMGEKLGPSPGKLSERQKEGNLRYQIIEAAKQVRWIPGYGLQQELDWLLNMDDWMISKKRYWGLALPIWECSKCGTFEVIGSREELKSRAMKGWEDFEGHTPHRPWIDKVKIKCSKCQALASRVADVGSPWLDAGIVAYSTLRYRHDRSYWKRWFPAELVAESLPGQFRNWFYAMLAMSTIVEREAPFRVCVGHGDVLGEDGRAMHKSWGNAIWFDEAVEKMGADVMRWMFCSSVPENNLLFGYNKANSVRKRFLIPFWNIYCFFITYARLDNWTPNDSGMQKSLGRLKSLSLLDRWALSKLNALIQDVTNSLNDFDVHRAAMSLEAFVQELSTWYVRRSRRRFWKSEKDQDKANAYATIHRCLTTLVQLLSPFIPFLTENMYQNLARTVSADSRESVHHNDWPVADEEIVDRELMDNMDFVVEVCSLGRAARQKAGLKLRQPLAEVQVVTDEIRAELLKRFESIILEELNVKRALFTSEKSKLLEPSVRLLPKAIGKKYGKLYPVIRAKVEEMKQEEIAAILEQGSDVELEVRDQSVNLRPEDFEITTRSRTGYSLSETDEIIVGVSTVLTDELEREGLARDLIRRIQNQRKTADFNISDKIEIYFEAGRRLTEAFEMFEDYIRAETLSVSIHKCESPKKAHIVNYDIKGEPLKVGIVRTGDSSTSHR